MGNRSDSMVATSDVDMLGEQDVERLAPVERALTNLEMVIERAAETVNAAGIFDIAALIDGFWLRAAMSEGRIELDRAVGLCKTYVDQAIAANSGNHTSNSMGHTDD